uniref:Uncharacterized protein n=1 Tax=Fagus sylvatica TaxID=28930 RepID=A0A2N9GRR9_FAGSY
MTKSSTPDPPIQDTGLQRELKLPIIAHFAPDPIKLPPSATICSSANTTITTWLLEASSISHPHLLPTFLTPPLRNTATRENRGVDFFVKDTGGGGSAAWWRVVDSIVVWGARTQGLGCDVGCDRSWGNRKASRGCRRSSRQSSLGDSRRDLLPEI